MKFKAVSLSDKGNFRKNNQDSIAYKENQYGQFLAVVCDGMGGHAHGEVASKIACEYLVSLFEKEDFSKLSKREIDKWFHLAIYTIKQHMDDYAFSHPEALDMGTTISALLVSQQGAFVLNIGDSRTYKVVKNHLKQVTIDQNLLNDKHARNDTQLQKSLSGLNLNEITYWKVLVSALGPTKSMKIDTFRIADPKGIYILTSDGVHDYIDDEIGMKILSDNKKAETKAKEFVEVAKMNLSKDNLSIIIAEVD